MDQYVTGEVIRRLREKKHMTQEELAEKLFVSSKAVSKWETGHGYPDISLLEPLAAALGISVIELFSGNHIENQNRSANIEKSVWYVCPVCGNAVFARGDTMISCCGIRLPALEAEEADPVHRVKVERVEDEIFVSSDHSMSKEHFLSFVAYMTTDRCEITALYPEGGAEARFFRRGSGRIYVYCNQHGLFMQKV